jgi:2OG-Fe(II) oxygenase superfamily
MARYEGHRGGYSHGHRDNIAPYLYRRFAMSINLNTEEFEGGELCFPEFGDQRYRPESGTAIVFSSSLLREAMHVTAGRRFVFLAFLLENSRQLTRNVERITETGVVIMELFCLIPSMEGRAPTIPVVRPLLASPSLWSSAWYSSRVFY